MISYQKELWKDFSREAPPLWLEHHREVATDKAHLLPSPDHPRYRALEGMGQLLILTARDKGKMIGYIVLAVCRHPHYDLTIAYEDMNFLSRSHRKGLRSPWFTLEKFAEREAKAMGAQQLLMHSKGANRLGHVLAKLYFWKSDELWTRVL